MRPSKYEHIKRLINDQKKTIFYLTLSSYNERDCFGPIYMDPIDNNCSEVVELQVSISPTFYKQLLLTQIPKVQKRQSSHQCLFALLQFRHAIAVGKMVVKSTQGVNISVILWLVFVLVDLCWSTSWNM